MAVELDIGTAGGGGGRDYSDIQSWEDDLDSALYDSDKVAVGICYNDGAFDEAVVINGGGTQGLTSRTLTVAAGERHDGTAGTGARVVLSTQRTVFTVSIANTVVEWLELNLNSKSSSVGCISTNDGTTTPTIYFRNLLVHEQTGNPYGGMIRTSEKQAGVLNCIVYNSTITGAFKDAIGIHVSTGGSDPRLLYNNTVYNININNTTNDSAYGIYAPSGNVITTKNNVVCSVNVLQGAGSAACYNLVGTGTAAYNLSSDATASGTGSLANKTASNQFVSTAGGSEDLHLKAGADAIDAGTDLGTTPTGVNIDINGRDRDSEGDTWDMGAHEYVAGGGIPYDEKNKIQVIPIYHERIDNQSMLEISKLQAIPVVSSKTDTGNCYEVGKLQNIPVVSSQISSQSSLETGKLQNIPAIVSLADYQSMLETEQLQNIPVIDSRTDLLKNNETQKLINVTVFHITNDNKSNFEVGKLQIINIVSDKADLVNNNETDKLINIVVFQSESDTYIAIGYYDERAKLQILPVVSMSLDIQSMIETSKLQVIPVISLGIDIRSNVETGKLQVIPVVSSKTDIKTNLELNKLQNIPIAISGLDIQSMIESSIQTILVYQYEEDIYHPFGVISYDETGKLQLVPFISSGKDYQAYNEQDKLIELLTYLTLADAIRLFQLRIYYLIELADLYNLTELADLYLFKEIQ